MLGFAVVHLARFFRKFRADVVGILGEMVAKLLKLGTEFPFLRRNHRDGRRRRGGGSFGCRGRRGRRFDERTALLRATGQPRRHDRLFHLGRAALRTGHKAALGLLFESGRILEPAFESVALLANECVSDHSAPRITCRWAGSAMGSTISKRRPCCSDGMRARALATSAGSISAMTIPGSIPPSAMMRPQGSTISEWPNVSLPFSCVPPCAAAKTKQPFSIARLRMRTCQCASPVCLVNADGIASMVAPASARAR